MSTYKIYSYPDNFRVWKTQIAAAYNHIDIEVVTDFKFGVDNKTPEFLRKNPLGKVPVLETPQGSIFESNAIARYVARIRNDTDLYGSSFFESSQVDQWVDAVANELEPALTVLYYYTNKIYNISEEQHGEALKDIEKFLNILNNYLLTRTYLVGNKITLADIVVTSSLVNIYRQTFGKTITSQFINLNRWFLTCVNQPNFAKVLGPVAAGEAPAASAAPASSKAAPSSPKAAPSSPKGKGKEKGKDKPKEDKPKEAAKAKSPKATPASQPAFDDEEDKPKKEKNVLDSLPPTKMILDAVKKNFFDCRKNQVDFFAPFWNNTFDADGYCIYYADYKYNDENNVYFMTCNLVTGYIQRLEELRKYAFGVLNVTGVDEDTKPFNVNGVFIFRGPKPPTEMLECPDTEYYTLTPLDHKNNADRALIQEAFLADSFKGHAILERKYFK
jgi:elongation factor 1-gamma